MRGLTRRQSLLLGAGAVGGATLLEQGAWAAGISEEVPVADVKAPDFTPEKGANLHVLRPAKFVDPDEQWFRANTKKFTESTGVPVALDFVSWAQLGPQTAVAAQTGAGPDIVIGWGADPHVYESKLVDMSTLANYLGAKYGGWFALAVVYGSKWGSGGKRWVSIPMGGTSSPAVYRQSWVKEAGFEEIPNDLDKFLTLCKKLKKNGHPPGWALSHAVGDAPAFAEWLLWSHGAYAIDREGKVALESKQTINAINYCKELYPTMISGVTGWNGSSNNEAFAAGEISMTFNGVSIYYVCKSSKDKRLNAIAEDTNNVLPPFGASKGHAPETALTISAMLFKHSKYPNAAQDYIRFMMEAAQYAPWLSNCYGYWSNPLKAYSKMAFWDADPKIAAYKAGMATPYYQGYQGPVGANSSSISANFILADMFAKAATGNSSPEAAMKFAANQIKRYYKD